MCSKHVKYPFIEVILFFILIGSMLFIGGFLN